MPNFDPNTTGEYVWGDPWGGSPAVLRYLLEKVRVTKIDKQEPFVVHGDIQGRKWPDLAMKATSWGDVGVDDHTTMKQ